VQFGLSPEQEVEQAAGAAWFDGRQRAVVLAPSSAFGERLSSHFARYWRSLGGKVVATKTYAPNAADYSPSAAQLALALGVDAAPVDSVPRDSLKADFIFLIANPHDARLLKPQIDAQRLTGFPIYATSHVFSGRPDAQQDRDLDGIYFCDIPWLLHAYDSGQLSSTALAPEIAKTSPDFVKLIALGIDAYRMAKMIPSMTPADSHLFDGATGLLTLQSGNWVQRQLECAQFEGGTPQARGLAPILRPAEADRP
jgi:outer membrane PBP1 activator LpoA protein